MTTPARYRPTTTDVEAVRWTGANTAELVAFAGRDFATIDPEDRDDDPDVTAEVFDRGHGRWRPLRAGAWLVRDMIGGWRVHDDESFRRLYEPVGEGR